MRKGGTEGVREAERGREGRRKEGRAERNNGDEVRKGGTEGVREAE